VYARGGSYLTDDPAACANCHVMREQYDGWIAASHRAVAVCNDCHTPPGLLGKYATKARNGFWHSVAFTSAIGGRRTSSWTGCTSSRTARSRCAIARWTR
jgi:cytochrome c nitrite reductase small subunit